MRLKSQSVVLSTLLLVVACDDSTTPGPIPTSGTIIIDSRVRDNRVGGFSFARATIIFSPNAESLLPDIGVMVQINEQGSIIGTFLAPSDFPRPTFCMLKQYSTIDSAQAYFQAVAEIPETSYVDLAIPVNIGQVWAVRTRDNKYAKILIRNARTGIDSLSSTARTLWGEVEFQWAFQPNGTRQF